RGSTRVAAPRYPPGDEAVPVAGVPIVATGPRAAAHAHVVVDAVACAARGSGGARGWGREGRGRWPGLRPPVSGVLWVCGLTRERVPGQGLGCADGGGRDGDGGGENSTGPRVSPQPGSLTPRPRNHDHPGGAGTSPSARGAARGRASLDVHLGYPPPLSIRA